MTTLTAPANPVVIADVRSGTNSALDFYATVFMLIASGALVAGDHLICDNASIHKADEIHNALAALLAAAGVRLVFLPAYSPETQPNRVGFCNGQSASP